MKPKNHIILVGMGPIAQSTAQELSRRGISFVRIVEPAIESTPSDIQVVRGDPADDSVLREAGIKTARMIIAAGEDDGDNAFIALAAKDLNPDIRVLAVARSARSMRRMRLARADLVFAPFEVGGRLLSNLVEGTEIPTEFADLLDVSRRK